MDTAKIRTYMDELLAAVSAELPTREIEDAVSASEELRQALVDSDAEEPMVHGMNVLGVNFNEDIVPTVLIDWGGTDCKNDRREEITVNGKASVVLEDDGGFSIRDVVVTEIIKNQRREKSSEDGFGKCLNCETPLMMPGGYGETGMCGPCATGEASTVFDG
jgi:hypothetical protein